MSGSSAIVIATYLDSVSRDVRSFSTGTGLYTGDAQTIGFQRFEVVQTLKGRTTPGDVLEVVNGLVSYDLARFRSPAEEWAHEVLSPVEGQEYVLFLNEFPFPPHFDATWGFAGEPRMATVSEDGALRFLLTTRFVEQFREAGLLVSSAGEPAPFAATLDGVKAEIERQVAAAGAR